MRHRMNKNRMQILAINKFVFQANQIETIKSRFMDYKKKCMCSRWCDDADALAMAVWERALDCTDNVPCNRKERAEKRRKENRNLISDYLSPLVDLWREYVCFCMSWVFKRNADVRSQMADRKLRVDVFHAQHSSRITYFWFFSEICTRTIDFSYCIHPMTLTSWQYTFIMIEI